MQVCVMRNFKCYVVLVVRQFDTALCSGSVVGAWHPGHSLRSRGRLSSGRMVVMRSEQGVVPTSVRPEDRAPTPIRSGQHQIETALGGVNNQVSQIIAHTNSSMA